MPLSWVQTWRFQFNTFRMDNSKLLISVIKLNLFEDRVFPGSLSFSRTGTRVGIVGWYFLEGDSSKVNFVVSRNCST